jgi:pimeloyl-ACP methyl ester carboxylesterase
VERWADLHEGRLRYLYGLPRTSPTDYPQPPLLLIHGLLGYSFSWRYNLPPLAHNFEIFAPDMLGTGFSARRADMDCSMAAAAGRLLRFMDVVGIATADVIGTSHGGAVAAAMAAEAPGRVRRLVLAAPVNPWSEKGRRRARMLGSRLGGALSKKVFPLLKPAHGYVLRRLYGDARRIPVGTVEGYEEALRVPGSVEYLVGVMACWRGDLEYMQKVYERIGDKPVLLLWGDRDRAVLPASAAELQRRMPKAELLVLPGVGHMPYEEAPERFNKAVGEFLGREHSPMG